MYRIFVITGLGALVIIVTVGQLGRYLPGYTDAAGQRQDARHVQQQAQQQDFPKAKEQRQEPRHCYHCAISPADLSLGDMSSYGVTITNHSKSTLEEITFEVTMQDCPPGYGPTATNSVDQCVIAGQESKRADVLIPPGQARGFRSRVDFHDLPLPPPHDQRFFLWRIVSAKGMNALP